VHSGLLGLTGSTCWSWFLPPHCGLCAAGFFFFFIGFFVGFFTGAACALACISLPGFARLFLDVHRAEVETRQYAESLFLSHELYATRGRTGVLLLVSLFERQVIMLIDTGLAKRLGRDVSQGIVTRMTMLLAAGLVAKAFEAGLDGLTEVLGATAPAAEAGNELPNGILEEKGP